MSMLCRSTVKIFAIITSVWLFYFLSAFIMIGPIKVEVSVGEDHETFTLTRGYHAIFPRNTMLSRLIKFLHILPSATLSGIFIFYVGNAVRKRLDKTITNRKGVLEADNKTSVFTLKSIATSILFSVACLTVVILVRNNLYLKGLARMGHQAVTQYVSRPEKGPSVYLVNVKPSLAFYYSIIIIGFLLSFSHWLPLIFQTLPNEDSKDELIVHIDMYREDLLQNDQGRGDDKNAETASRLSALLQDNLTRIASIKENELSITLV